MRWKILFVHTSFNRCCMSTWAGSNTFHWCPSFPATHSLARAFAWYCWQMRHLRPLRHMRATMYNKVWGTRRAKLSEESAGLEKALPQVLKAGEVYHISERATATRKLVIQVPCMRSVICVALLKCFKTVSKFILVSLIQIAKVLDEKFGFSVICFAFSASQLSTCVEIYQHTLFLFLFRMAA